MGSPDFGYDPFVSTRIALGLGLLLVCACGDAEPPARRASPTAPASAEPTPTPPSPPIAPAEVASPVGPSWARAIEPRVPGFRAGASSVPQVRDAAALYESASEAPGALATGVLLCRVILTHAREWDAAGMFGRNVAPDVNVHVRWGDAREERIPLPEDAYEGVFSLPLGEAPSSPLSVRLVDRDLAADDPVTRFELAAPIALPIVRSDDLATLRCRALSSDEALRRARVALETAGSKLRALETRPRPRALEAEPDAMDRELVPVRAAIRDAASFVGYAHPDVRALVERVDAVERAMLEKLALAFDREAAHASDAPVALGRDVTVSVQGLACGREGTAPARCLVRVSADYARIPTPPGFAEPISVRLHARGARPIPCVEGGEPGRTPSFVRSTGRVEHSFTCTLDEGFSIPAGPWLVRLSSHATAAFVRASAGAPARGAPP